MLEQLAEREAWMQKHLGELVVYPGHPLVLACMVMDRYPSLAVASHHDADHPTYAALSDSFIPGSGCAVYAALDFLHYAQTIGLAQAYTHGERYWSNYERNAPHAVTDVARGRAQAERLTPYFEERFAQWNKPAN